MLIKQKDNLKILNQSISLSLIPFHSIHFLALLNVDDDADGGARFFKGCVVWSGTGLGIALRLPVCMAAEAAVGFFLVVAADNLLSALIFFVDVAALRGDALIASAGLVFRFTDVGAEDGLDGTDSDGAALVACCFPLNRSRGISS
jgi:hypothetical protein